MGVVISAYSQKAYKEFVLPAVNNTEIKLILEKGLFGIKKDLVLELEIMNFSWHFIQGDCAIFMDSEPYDGQRLKDQDSYVLCTQDQERLYLIVRIQERLFAPYLKYNLKNISEISIGSREEATIRYSYIYNGKQYISKDHAKLQSEAGIWQVEDVSANGTFLNNKHVEGKQRLEYGDHINIWGLDLIFLGEIFAVGKNENVIVASQMTRIDPEKMVADTGDENCEKKEKRYYHRAPRNIEPLETEGIEIEAPPAPKEENRTPLLMQIGPALTMMIPMMLGSGMAVLSSRMNGASSTGFMYTGLITAGCSGLLGAFWALNNIKYAEKRRKQEETHRYDAYSRYLIKCTDKVKEKYERNIKILQERYPSVDQIAGDGEAVPAEMWGRNVGHEDFLYHRLGIGDIPFQVPIIVPKEKFTLIEDTLTEKPKIILENYKMLRNVPVGIDLIRNQLIGIVGGENKIGAYAVAYALIAQIITQNCYTDVKLIFICNGVEESIPGRWEFALWLPHVWSENKKFRYVACNQSEAGDVFFELAKVMRRREEEKANIANSKSRIVQMPYYIMFLEDGQMASGEVIEKYIYARENLGLTTILLTEHYEDLPNACECVIEKDNIFSGVYSVRSKQSEKQEIKFDAVSAEQLNCLARTISEIEVNEAEIGGEIPSSVTFFDMYGIGKLSELRIEERWKKNRNYDSMKSLIGFKAGGQPCYLDLHEKYHGPHGLVAGTTGSGKSETLQTYILSLAINFSPDDVGFFIIDYKGGGMGNLFSNLPHVLGQISNLSGNQIRRAMVSIKSENLRRQRIFNENGVNNINLYTTLYKNGEAKLPVPHLFIVIDEFAELKREEPDFMRELISVAQVGRSLGVHLILATQKPAGTVDDNIWSNARFHLCLRVQDRQDSMDMLHKPDAAYLTSAGRGYLQVGNDEIYEQFQSGWSGAVYDEEDGNDKQLLARMLTASGKTAIAGNYAKSQKKAKSKQKWILQLLELFKNINRSIADMTEEKEKEVLLEWQKTLEDNGVDFPSSEYNLRLLRNLLALYLEHEKKQPDGEIGNAVKWILETASERKVKLPERKEKTQLDAVVEYLGQVAEKEVLITQPPLWLPLLPEKIYLSEIVKDIYDETRNLEWTKYSGQWSLKAEIGLCDDPVNQIQMPMTLDFSVDGNHAVCGVPMSGKSTFLQTVIYALLKKYSPEYLNVYILDFSSRALEAFEKAPQVGGILYENDLDTIGKFFHMLENMLQERKHLFSGGNYNQYISKHGTVCPAVLVAIDNVAVFREKTETKYDDVLLKLSRECAANGIYLLLSAASYGILEIPSRLGDNIRRTICLEMQDKYQYIDTLNTVHISTLPEAGIAGRGLVKMDDNIFEFQTCLAMETQDDYSRIEAIDRECNAMAESWKGRTAKVIPSIPEKPVWSEFSSSETVLLAAEKPAFLPVGYEYETADIYNVNLCGSYCYVISGKAKTGKTNLLRIMIRSAALKNARVYVVEPDSNELMQEAAEHQAGYIATCEEYCQFIAALIPVFQERYKIKKECRLHSMENEEIFDKTSTEQPIFIFISDLVRFIKMLYSKDGEKMGVGATMTNLLEKGDLMNIYFVACFDWEERVEVTGKAAYEAYVKYKTGIHLGGNADNQRLLDFSGISMQEKMRTEKAGIGLTAATDLHGTVKVVIPLARG